MRPIPQVVAAIAVITLSLAGCSVAEAPRATDSPSTSPSADAGPAETTNQFAGISTYYPVAVGNTWVYSIDYGNGTVITDTEVMTAVVAEGDGARATIDRTFTWDDKSHPDVTDSVDYIFMKDGSLKVPFQTLPTAGGDVTVNDSDLAWPNTAEFEAGTPRTGQITASVSNAGTVTNETIDFTIVGAGVEDVTVAAGTYSARKLLQNLVVSIPDLGVTGIAINSVSWLSEDVGPVRTEIPDSSGGPTIVQQLVSFTPGS